MSGRDVTFFLDDILEGIGAKSILAAFLAKSLPAIERLLMPLSGTSK